MRSARLVSLVSLAALLGAVGLGVHAGVVSRRALARPFPGFFVYPSGAVASVLRRDWEGPRVGLKPRDRIVAVEGRAAASGEDVWALLAETDRGEVTLDVESPEGARRSVTVRLGRLVGSDLALAFLLPFGIGWLYLAIAALIFFLKRDLVGGLVASLCTVASMFYLTMFDAHTTYAWSRIWISYPLLGPLSLHLFSCFPEDSRFHRARFLLPIYAAALVIVTAREAALHDPYILDRTSLGAGFFLASCFLGDLALLLVTVRRGASPEARNKAKTLAVGLFSTITLAVVWAFVSRFGPRVVTADWVMALSALFPLLIAYATLKRNLFDLEVVLQRSLAYGLASALVVLMYLALVTLLGSALAPVASSVLPETAGAVLSTLAAAALFHPVRVRVQTATGRLFMRGRLDRAEALLELLRALPAAASPLEVGERLVEGVAHLLGLGSAALLSAREDDRLELIARTGNAEAEIPFGVDPALTRRMLVAGRTESLRDLAEDPSIAPATLRSLEALGGSALAPLRARGRLVGMLVLGAPRSGARLSYDDLRVLDAIAPAAAIAVENALLVSQHAQRERLAALGGVAAVIVHEINNPLGIIRLAAGQLRKKFEPGTSGDELGRTISEEVDRMDVTLRQILTFARPQEPQLGPCNVSQLVGRTLDRFRPQLDAAAITVREDLDGTPPLSADGAQLERVFLNLFVNAHEAMGEGGGELLVRTRLVKDGRGGDALEVAVEDTGPGMPEEVRRKVFQPFFSTRHGGTGLGLAIVDQIVREHGGTIDVESAPGQGARFRVRLPLAPAEGPGK